MISQIRPRDLAQWHAQVGLAAQPILFDVREPAELVAASVPAGTFDLRTIPMGSVPARLAELDPDQPIACLCHHGARSMQVATYLSNQGFGHVVNVAGGIDAWSLELDPTVPRY